MQTSRGDVVDRFRTAAPLEGSVAHSAMQNWDSKLNNAETVEDAATMAISIVVSVLFRTHRCHPLLVGLPGIGRTHAVQDLARQASSFEIPFLSEHKFRWIDCRHVSPEDSRACLESIFASVVSEPKLVLCLDGIASLLRRSGGGSNRPLVCGLLDRPGLRVIGVMTPWEYADLVAGDAEMLRYFARVDLHEPDEATAEVVAAEHAAEFAKTQDVAIAPELVRRTVRLTSHFLLNEYHPAKDINVLREACERLAFERLMHHSDRQTLELSDIASVLHERTGIPAETLLGCSDETDFAAALSAAVVGQPNAVETAARELRLIKAGLSAPGKPASVMLFAGLTGVGKTELAKRIAEVYSTSRRLQVYSMGNFTEPHSVSGLIGVPPGYVGHAGTAGSCRL